MHERPQLAAPDQSSRVRFRVVAFLGALSFLTYYDRQCIVRAQESIQLALAITDEQMGLVLGAFWLAYSLFEIPSGWLGERMGARITLTRIVLAWSLFTALTGAATGFVSLLTYRFLFGVGEAGAFPNMARIQSRWLPLAERARAGGVLWLMARWGAAFAPLIFGTMTRGFEALQSNLGGSGALAWFASIPSWRLGFIASGVLGVLWCLVFYPWYRDDPTEKPAVKPAELRHILDGRGAVASHAHAPGVWRRLFGSPSLCALSAYYIFGGFGWSFYVSWMPKYFKEVHGVAFEKSELSSAWPLVCGGIACLVGGVLSDALVRRTGWRRLGRAVFPVTGCFVAAAATLAIPNVSTQREATILMCVAAAAFDFGQAANWASIVDIGGRHAALAMGMINMIGNLGASAQPYIGARIFNTFGWNTLFVVYAGAFLLAMATWAVINPTRTFYEERRAN
jgi:ACS family glucarate transporter-like MFS transporter